MVAGSIHTKRVIEREFVINIKPERERDETRKGWRERKQKRDREMG